MEEAHVDDVIGMARHQRDVSKLIRKLRWIDLEEEARQLQLAMSSAAPGQGGTVPIETFSTD
jgi:hypothetical protein